MHEDKWLAEQFDAQRARLRVVAYRMLGSPSEADDAVQEAWLRLSSSDAGAIQNLGGWLTTVVARVCLDMLRSRKSRREEPFGWREPQPVMRRSHDVYPEADILLADSIGPALLVVLETLEPAERVAFVLHDMFDLSFKEIAPIVGRSEAAARQLASRARRRVQGMDEAPEADFSAAGEKWSRPFLQLQGKAISRPFSRCLIRMSYSEPTTQPFKRPQRIKLPERRSYGVRSKATTPSPRRSRDARERHNLRSSTVSPEPSGLRVENHGSFSFLRFGPTRSRQST